MTTSPTDNREHIAAKLSELFNAHKLEVDPFPALADWCISEIDKARVEAAKETGEHILYQLMPNNEETEDYDRGDCIEVFNDIQNYVWHLATLDAQLKPQNGEEK